MPEIEDRTKIPLKTSYRTSHQHPACCRYHDWFGCLQENRADVARSDE